MRTLCGFSQKPDYDKDGSYGFVLSDKARDYATSVSAYVFEIWDDEVIELGETCDVYGDYYMTDPARFSIEDGEIMYW